MLLYITTLFLLLYGALIFYYYYHWLHIKSYQPQATPAIFISVVVAARNEETTINALLQSLQLQTYPPHLFEVIVVDDFSTDKTTEVIKPYLSNRVKLIQPQVDFRQSSKKKAIEAGIREAKGTLMVITDADCVVPPQWLETIASFQQKTGAVFIAAPVKFTGSKSILSIFQSLDFLTLQGITAASVQAHFHSMCNGANLAYVKKVFEEVNGFSGIDKIASGDDMLLMYKIWKKYPHRVHYLKSEQAIVSTLPMPTWKQWMQQRIRWSSKATHYDDYRVTATLAFVYFFNCLFFVLLTAAFFQPFFIWLLIFYVAAKTLIEWPFVWSVARFYHEQKSMKYFTLLQPLHIFYVVCIGFISQLGQYEWKGRRTK